MRHARDYAGARRPTVADAGAVRRQAPTMDRHHATAVAIGIGIAIAMRARGVHTARATVSATARSDSDPAVCSRAGKGYDDAAF